MPKLIDTEELFRATVSVFAERGYDALTTVEVARRAGINEVTIYRRFGTKAGLVAAALAHGLLSAPFADLPVSDDVQADLLAMADAFQATFRSFGGAVLTLLFEASRHPELREAMAPLLVNMGGAVRVLEAHQRRGSLAPGDPWQQLVLLLSPFVARGLWARTGVAPPVELDTGHVVVAFLDGHRTPRSEP
jgi:AcrR family transcriptional regulator